MHIQAKRKRERTAIAFYLLFGCLCFLLLPQTVHAARTPASAVLTVEQFFTTSAASVSDVFSYELVAVNSTNPMPDDSVNGAYSFNVYGTNSVKINIDFPDTGVYSYTVLRSPSDTNVSGYVYDNTVYQITVTVTAQSNGALAAMVTVRNADNGKSAAIRFSHSYIYSPSDPSGMVDPSVKKTVSGNPRSDSVFTFKLTAGALFYPMPEGSVNGVKTMTIKGSGEKNFGTWTYTTEGTYYYTISEVNTHERNYTYDTAVYTITDIVKAVDNQLVVSRTVTNYVNKPVKACIFINKYKSSGGGGGGGGGTNQGGSTEPEGTNPGTENPGTETPGTEIPGTETPGTENPGTETPGTENPGTENPGTENPGGTDPEDATPDGNEGPITGDDTSVAFYLEAMAAGIMVVVGCIFGLIHLKKREKTEYGNES